VTIGLESFALRDRIHRRWIRRATTELQHFREERRDAPRRNLPRVTSADHPVEKDLYKRRDTSRSIERAHVAGEAAFMGARLPRRHVLSLARPGPDMPRVKKSEEGA
jgi:hypothetical protein